MTTVYNGREFEAGEHTRIHPAVTWKLNRGEFATSEIVPGYQCGCATGCGWELWFPERAGEDPATDPSDETLAWFETKPCVAGEGYVFVMTDEGIEPLRDVDPIDEESEALYHEFGPSTVKQVKKAYLRGWIDDIKLEHQLDNVLGEEDATSKHVVVSDRK